MQPHNIERFPPLATPNLQLATTFLESSPTLAVAVSGGADSMALLLLACAWAKERGGKAVAVTVDHGLRAASKTEAAQVAEWCKDRAIEHHILNWDAPKPESGIPEAARQARYMLLADFCKTHHILHLLTGHHADDQAETLFFRVARGSGLDGLAGMPIVSSMNGVRLLRPLLAYRKNTLEKFLVKNNQPWIEDPSNHNMRYSRNQLRRALSDTNDHHLSDRAHTVTDFFSKWRNALEIITARSLTQCVDIFPEGYAALKADMFSGLEKEIALRVLSGAIQTVSGEYYQSRSEKIILLYEDMHHGRLKKKRSLAGCIVQYKAKDKLYFIYREPKSIAAHTPISQDVSCVWDKRFTVSCRGSNHTLTLRALGPEGIKQLHAMPKFLPKPVLSALPSLWHLEELIAVPHIGYHAEKYPEIRAQSAFRPAKPLADAPFFRLNRSLAHT